MDRFVFNPGSIISAWFHPKFNTEKDSIEESFSVQTSNQDFSIDTQWKHTIQVAVYSMLRDLPKPHANFKNRRIWIHTSWICSSCSCASQVSNCQNRWPMMLRKMSGSVNSVQKCLMMKNFQTAMEAQDVNSCDSAKFLVVSPSTDEQ